MASIHHRYRYFAGRVLDILRQKGPAGLLDKALDSLGERLIPSAYRYWIYRYDRLSPRGRRALAAEIASRQAGPSISVLLSAGHAELPPLATAVRSVERQLYPARELCVVVAPTARRAVRALHGLPITPDEIASGNLDV
jgi:hypothetical protein